MVSSYSGDFYEKYIRYQSFASLFSPLMLIGFNAVLILKWKINKKFIYSEFFPNYPS